MSDRLVIASLYAKLYAHRAKRAATDTTKKIADTAVENQSELTCIGVTAVVVGVAARACGFKAGYAFAKSPNLETTVL